MAFNEQHRREVQRRRSEAARRRLAELRPLMNNTKWTEVLTTLTHERFWFQLRLIDSKLPSRLMCPSGVPWLDSAPGWVDGWFGGGFHLWELLWVRCPAVVPGELVQSVAPRHQNLIRLSQTLELLGKVPLTAHEAHLEIRGYETNDT